MKLDLGRFEDFGYAEVIQTGLSREEIEKYLRAKAKEMRVKIKIKHVYEHAKNQVVYDVLTGRCFIDFDPW